ncbi:MULTISPECIES: anaerobic ribonucleoside-triphosphate reductase [Pseudomonadaceae]|uniref:Anaerobic ribonucleoside-triphosphate reductase n=1 Tax=Halopseudomonas litoralis TaxID=797277 RepID=A0A1H1MBX6_9GAMM|nr:MULTISPECIES: anaerobic ribonucleoside-triphosphate reductase [Pseudomonadaceae]SDR84344.1 Anaerobic ribonucleoside-triphosphate reductase [Halopseudomonas litoralis]
MNQSVNTQLQGHERVRCEVWTRVMGYHRPVSSWNPGKQSEHRERQFFQPQSSASDGC